MKEWDLFQKEFWTNGSIKKKKVVVLKRINKSLTLGNVGCAEKQLIALEERV